MPVAALAPLGIIVGALTVTGIGLHYNHLLWAGGEVREPLPPRAPPTTAPHSAAVARGRMLRALRAATAAAAVALHSRQGRADAPVARVRRGRGRLPTSGRSISTIETASSRISSACSGSTSSSSGGGISALPVACASLAAEGLSLSAGGSCCSRRPLILSVRHLPGGPFETADSASTGEPDAIRVARGARGSCESPGRIAHPVL